jgi:chorismate mutase
MTPSRRDQQPSIFLWVPDPGAHRCWLTATTTLTPRAEPGAFAVSGLGPATEQEDSMTTMTETEAAAIPVLRRQIDSLDEAIARLVAERAKLSRRIQTARMNAGGTRVELGRERVILDTYRAALGPDGPALADAILQVCRGAR